MVSNLHGWRKENNKHIRFWCLLWRRRVALTPARTGLQGPDWGGSMARHQSQTTPYQEDKKVDPTPSPESRLGGLPALLPNEPFIVNIDKHMLTEIRNRLDSPSQAKETYKRFWPPEARAAPTLRKVLPKLIALFVASSCTPPLTSLHALRCYVECFKC